MKKVIALFTAVLLLTLCGCNAPDFEYDGSLVEETVSAEKQQLTYPASAEIIGDYEIAGHDDSDPETTAWHVIISNSKGKIYMQVGKIGEKLADLTKSSENPLSNVTSNYNETTGLFSQYYATNEYRSSYTASIVKEKDGRIKLSLKHRYLYTESGEIIDGIFATGYKTK